MAVNVKLQQIARPAARPPRRLRLDPRKPRRRKVQSVDKGVDELDRRCDIVIDRPWHPQKMLARESRNVTHAQFQPHARLQGIRLAPVFARFA